MDLEEKLDRMENKMDKLLKILGAEGSTRSPSEIKREAMATVLQFRQRQVKNKEK